jgi:hypothetical protein
LNIELPFRFQAEKTRSPDAAARTGVRPTFSAEIPEEGINHQRRKGGEKKREKEKIGSFNILWKMIV